MQRVLSFNAYMKMFLTKLSDVQPFTKCSLMNCVFFLYLPVILETKYLLIFNRVFVFNFWIRFQPHKLNHVILLFSFYTLWKYKKTSFYELQLIQREKTYYQVFEKCYHKCCLKFEDRFACYSWTLNTAFSSTIMEKIIEKK